MGRNLFEELLAGVDDMASHRTGELPLRSTLVDGGTPSVAKRIRLIEFHEGLTREELASSTGLKCARLRNLIAGKTRFRMDDIALIANRFPEYEYWLYTGKESIDPDQTNPMLKRTGQK